jgi:hypothetical protein
MIAIAYYYIPSDSISSVPFGQLTLDQIFRSVFPLLLILFLVSRLVGVPSWGMYEFTEEHWEGWGKFGLLVLAATGILIAFVVYH